MRQLFIASSFILATLTGFYWSTNKLTNYTSHLSITEQAMNDTTPKKKKDSLNQRWGKDSTWNEQDSVQRKNHDWSRNDSTRNKWGKDSLNRKSYDWSRNDSTRNKWAKDSLNGKSYDWSRNDSARNKWRKDSLNGKDHKWSRNDSTRNRWGKDSLNGKDQRWRRDSLNKKDSSGRKNGSD